MILFFYGPNTYAARQQLAKLTAEYRKKTGGDLGLERLDGAKLKADELVGALQAAPFLTTSRLVIIEALGTNKVVAPQIAKYLEDVPETTVAVFYDAAADQRTAYFKALTKIAKPIKFEPLTTPKLHQWVVRQAAAAGATIERPAVGRLLDLAGEDQWRLSNEIAKLAAHASPITAEDVGDMVEEGHSETIFNLVEAMTAGKLAVASRLYRQLRDDGLNEMYMLSMVIWQLRNLLFAKVAGDTTPAVLAKTAAMSPFVAGKMLSHRHALDKDCLKAAFLQAVDTDYRIKSGAGSADILVEQLIYDVAGKVAA